MNRREKELFAAYLVALLLVGFVSVGRVGIAWDEPNYFYSSYRYLSWFAHVAHEPSEEGGFSV